MPQLAVFPKAYLDELCLSGEMKLQQWIEMAASLKVDGLEFYSGFLELQERSFWPLAKQMASDAGLIIPMLCCSPDFTHPDPEFRQQQIELEKTWIEMTAELGGNYCRVLSGQRRPEVTRPAGIGYVTECLYECLEFAQNLNITLILENHYKDNYWTYPEFAQQMEIFCQIVEQIDHPYFGVNYDPSNTFLAGENPLELLDRVKQRVVTMHASDRYLAEGTLEDLRQEENQAGYAQRLRHGVIGQGLNDYDAIFSTLKSVNFDGWISVEDGVDGFEQLQQSVDFLKTKIAIHWP